MNSTDLLQVGTGNTAGVIQNGHSTLKGVDGMNVKSNGGSVRQHEHAERNADRFDG